MQVFRGLRRHLISSSRLWLSRFVQHWITPSSLCHFGGPLNRHPGCLPAKVQRPGCAFASHGVGVRGNLNPDLATHRESQRPVPHGMRHYRRLVTMTDSSSEVSTPTGKVSMPDSFADARGVLTVVAPSGSFNFMEVVTFVGPDLIRGNHYHAAYHERAFVQTGSIDIVLRTQDSDGETRLTAVDARRSSLVLRKAKCSSPPSSLTP